MTGTVRSRCGLLDVNALFALAWPNHRHHGAIREWMDQRSVDGWATTPVTQSGLVRLSSNRAVTEYATNPAQALGLLAELGKRDGHEFWPDDVDGVVSGAINRAGLTGYRQVTDVHLLSLADRYGGRLVTFDAKLRGLLKSGFDHLLEVLD